MALVKRLPPSSSGCWEAPLPEPLVAVLRPDCLAALGVLTVHFLHSWRKHIDLTTASSQPSTEGGELKAHLQLRKGFLACHMPIVGD